MPHFFFQLKRKNLPYLTDWNKEKFFDWLQALPLIFEVQPKWYGSYYPFGLTMSGISSKAAGGIENKKKYNGIEFENDLELNIYDAELRELDPQTGRWWEIDPKTDQMHMWSTYASNFDNPIRYKDPLGDEPDGECCGEFWKTLGDAGDKIMLSASGSLWGSLNTISGGLISTDPFNVRPNLTSEEKMYWDNAVTVGRIAPLISPSPGGKRISEPTLELAPVGGAPKVNVKVTIESQPQVAIPNQVQAKGVKGPKDLVAEAKAAQEKLAEAAARKATREQATRQGNERTGNSNQGTRGSHASGGKKPEKHEAAEARRAREQKAADEKK